MPAPAPLLAAGLSVAALLLSACGGSDPGPSAGASSASATASSSSSSAGGTPSSAEAAAFCSQAVSLEQSVNATIGQARTDPTQLAPALQQLADRYAAVDAPPEIAADWSTLVDGIRQVATAAQGIDFTTPKAAQQLQTAIKGVEGRLTAATTHVSDYASANCPSTAPPS